MTIEIISGSPRQSSTSARIARFLETWINGKTGHKAAVIDMKDWLLPPVEKVFTSPETTPDEWKPLAQRLFGADAIILITPEYNGSYSPVMKNMLDHFPKQLHKAFGIVTASPGSFGGMRAAQQLLLLVPGMFGIVSPFMLIIPQVDKKFDESGKLIDESFFTQVHTFVNEFIWLAERLSQK